MKSILDKPLTPCVGICSCTSQGDEICRGCKRTATEVRDWNTYTNETKKQIINKLQETKK